MSFLDELQRTVERNHKAMRLRPGVAQGTATTTARMRPGSLACDVSDGDWRLVGDLSKGEGGTALGPDPGVFARAGLATCLAMGYILRAAERGIPIDDVEVVVEADYDGRASYGLDADGHPPGWTGLRYTAHITSSAPEAQLRELMQLADARSPVLDDFRRALDIKGELKIMAPAAE